jgi:hypothetical protein
MQYTTWESLNDLDSVLICSKEIMNLLMNTSIRKHILIYYKSGKHSIHNIRGKHLIKNSYVKITEMCDIIRVHVHVHTCTRTCVETESLLHMIPVSPVRRHGDDMSSLCQPLLQVFRPTTKQSSPHVNKPQTNTPRSWQTPEQIPAVSHTFLAPP